MKTIRIDPHPLALSLSKGAGAALAGFDKLSPSG